MGSNCRFLSPDWYGVKSSNGTMGLPGKANESSPNGVADDPNPLP